MKLSLIAMNLSLLFLGTALLPLNASADNRNDYTNTAKNYLNKNGVTSKTLKKQQQQRNWQTQNKQKTTSVIDDERTMTPGKKTIKNKSKKAQKRERARKRVRESKSQNVND